MKTSKVKGVSFHKASGRWRARIYPKGKTVCLYDGPDQYEAERIREKEDRAVHVGKGVIFANWPPSRSPVNYFECGYGR